MIQGAANYAWNLIEEALAMVWKPAVATRGQAVKAQFKSVPQVAEEMREVPLNDKTTSDLQHEQHRGVQQGG